MSFTSIREIANDKNKPECIFSHIEMFYVETAKENNTIQSSNQILNKKKKLDGFYFSVIHWLFEKSEIS